MHTRIGDICRMIMVIVVLLLPGSVWIPDAKGAGLDETFRIERRGTIPAEVDGTADDEEQPIMTIGYRPRQFRSNPLLRGHSTVQRQMSPAQFNPGGLIIGIMIVLLVLLCVLVIGVLSALFS